MFAERCETPETGDPVRSMVAVGCPPAPTPVAPSPRAVFFTKFLSAISLNSSSFWKTFSRIFFSSSVKWAVSCSLVSEDECDCESIDSIGGRWAPVSVPATGEVEPPMGATVPDVEVIEELRCCREEALL